MDITKGSLGDISRTASKERSRSGSRESTVSLTEMGTVIQDWPGSLEAQWDTQDGHLENVLFDQDSSDEENEDLDLQKAIAEMNRLDRILAIKLSQEKELKRQGRELHQKLCQELKDVEAQSSQDCSDEVENIRLLWELTSNTLTPAKDSSEDEDFIPAFGTQVPDDNNDLNFKVGNKEVRVHTEPSGFLDEDHEVRRDEQTASQQNKERTTKHRQDFVRKNTELAGGAGGLMMMMTQKEKERLDEILNLENESSDDPSARPKDLDCMSSPECSNYVENTWLYMELTSRTLTPAKYSSEEEDFIPVFGTQVPDDNNDLNFRVGNKEVRVHTEPSGFLEEDQEVRRDQTTSQQNMERTTKHRQDFVRKNIELAGRAGGLMMMMTQKEKERLEEILNDESYDYPSAEPKPGEGYQPDEAELQRLLQIDARLQLLLPDEDFLSVQSPYAARSSSQGGPTGMDGKLDVELMAEEKALRGLTEARDRGKCLQDIQQLQLLEQSQQATSLPEEQLRSLLMECEMAQSRLSGSGAGDSTSPCCVLDGRAISLLIKMPRLTSHALSDLMREASGTPTTPYHCEEDAQD